jgi:hypothetical protein
MEFRQGDLVFIPPGHDGWTVGDEPAVFLQILGGCRLRREGIGPLTAPTAP